MMKYLRNTGLFGNNYRHIVKHGLERGNAERLRYAGHYIEITHGIHTFHIFTPQETGKAEILSHLKFSDPFHHSRHHIASSRHDKMHTGNAFQDEVSSLYKVIRPFLKGNSSQKKNDFLIPIFFRREQYFTFTSGDGIMDYGYLFRRYAVTVYNIVFRIITYGDHMIGYFHAVLLYIVNNSVYVFPATVKLQGMGVVNIRPATYHLGTDAGKNGSPVMAVYKVKIFLLGNAPCRSAVADNFCEKIGAIIA